MTHLLLLSPLKSQQHGVLQYKLYMWYRINGKKQNKTKLYIRNGGGSGVSGDIGCDEVKTETRLKFGMLPTNHNNILHTCTVMWKLKKTDAQFNTGTKYWHFYLVSQNLLATSTHTSPFYGSLDYHWDNPGEPVPEETFTHSHLSWSSVIPYMLPPSIMFHGILSVQFTCLTVFFHSLSSSFLWSTSWSGILNFILHKFLHPIIISFSQHMFIPS